MILKGKIYKGIGGFYYVVAASTLYECRARGVFRKQGRSPLVGDIVDIEPTGEEGVAYLVDIHERSSELIRPACANADHAMLVFSVTHPDVAMGLIDRFLINMEYQQMETSICITKSDLVTRDIIESRTAIYRSAGYRVITLSNKTGEGLSEVRELLRGRSTVLSGPSGVGKSSLIRSLLPDSPVEVGAISERIGRGKNTTRHTELIPLGDEGYIYDTPGYSSIDPLPQDEAELGVLMRDIAPYLGECRFTGCSHISEPDCGVKEAVDRGDIAIERYDSYVEIYRSIKARRKW